MKYFKLEPYTLIVIRRATNIHEAWEKTIEKWEILSTEEIHEIVFPPRDFPSDAPINHSCGLCDMFMKAGEHHCMNCLISEKTGRYYCEGTLFDKWLRSFYGGDYGNAMEIAAEFLVWLKELRKETEPKDDEGSASPSSHAEAPSPQGSQDRGSSSL